MSSYDPDPLRQSEGEGEQQYDEQWMDHPCRQLVEHEVAAARADARAAVIEEIRTEADRLHDDIGLEYHADMLYYTANFLEGKSDD